MFLNEIAWATSARMSRMGGTYSLTYFLSILFLESGINLFLLIKSGGKASGYFFMKIKEKSISLFNYIFTEIIILRITFNFISIFIIRSYDNRFLIYLFYIVERLRFFISLNFNHNIAIIKRMCRM